MMRTHASRSFRQPVLALLAAAGLVVGSGGAGAAVRAGAAPIVPGQPAVASAIYAQPSALAPIGTALHGGLSQSVEGTTPRLDGAAGPAFRTRLPAQGVGSGWNRPGTPRTVDPDIAVRAALARAGRDAAPPNAPPSLPS